MNIERKFLIVIAILFFLSACSGNGAFQGVENKSIKSLDIEFQASAETAVRTRGGYKVYLGSFPGFAVEDSLKTINLPGSTEKDGKVKVTLPDIPLGKYYIKTIAYSDLIDPNTGKEAISSFSDEVFIHVQ